MSSVSLIHTGITVGKREGRWERNCLPPIATAPPPALLKFEVLKREYDWILEIDLEGKQLYFKWLTTVGNNFITAALTPKEQRYPWKTHSD